MLEAKEESTIDDAQSVDNILLIVTFVLIFHNIFHLKFSFLNS